MKQYKLILLVSFLILGCQSEIEQNYNTNKNATLMSFYAGIETPTDTSLTKTILDGSPTDAYRNVLWEYQDEVYVTNGAESSKFINTTEGISDVALLEGELPQATEYYAAYPYDMVNGYTSSGFTIELPTVQSYCKEGVASDSFPMVAQCENGVFDFKNLCGIFVIQLLGEQSISSITFSGKDANGNYLSVAGNGTISMDYSDIPTLVMNNSAETSVSLSSSAGVQLSSTIPTSFHIVLPVGTYNTFMLVIKATDGTIMTVESEKSLEIKRSNRTTAVPLAYSGVIHYQDLNESGETANCYIISESGSYKFKATKGNDTNAIDNIITAEVLWESFGTDVTPSVGEIVKNATYKDGYIEFDTAPTLAEGNAVIAAKDASGTILWSWHIWVTDVPEEQVYYNNAGTMLDRNLGATSTTPGDVTSLGLLYQWGRKDPFLSFSGIYSTSLAASTYNWPSEEPTASIEYTIQNPTTYITSNDDSIDWLQDASSDNNRWQSTKTIYDPCPAGYRVPDGGSTGIWSNALSSSEYTYDTSSMGVNFSKIFGDDEMIWYPGTGHSSASGSFDNNGYTQYWSVTPRDTIRIYNLNASVPDIDTSSWGYRAQGAYVRCMKISE